MCMFLLLLPFIGFLAPVVLWVVIGLLKETISNTQKVIKHNNETEGAGFDKFTLNSTADSAKRSAKRVAKGTKIAVKGSIQIAKAYIKTLKLIINLIRFLISFLISIATGSALGTFVVVIICISVISSSVVAVANGGLSFGTGGVQTESEESNEDVNFGDVDTSSWLSIVDSTWKSCQAWGKENKMWEKLYGKGRSAVPPMYINGKKRKWVTDCSGTVSLCIQVLIDDDEYYKPSGCMTSIPDQVKDYFTLLKIGTDIKSVSDLRPGDIVVAPGSHTEVVAQVLSDSGGDNVLKYNWGSDKNCKYDMPYKTTYVMSGNTIKEGSWHTYTYVWRYIGK